MSVLLGREWKNEMLFFSWVPLFKFGFNLKVSLDTTTVCFEGEESQLESQPESEQESKLNA